MKKSDAFGFVGGVALLLSASVWMPVVGWLVSLLTPLPFLYFFVKLGASQALKLAAMTVLIVVLLANLTDQSQLIFFCIEFGLLGTIIFLLPYLLTVSIVKKYGNKNAYVMISIILLILIMQTVTDVGLFHRTANMLFFIFAAVEINLPRRKYLSPAVSRR